MSRDYLAEVNAALRSRVIRLRDSVSADSSRQSSTPRSSPLSRLEQLLARSLGSVLELSPDAFQFKLIDRSRLNADIALTVPQWLQAGGAQEYIRNRIPALERVLSRLVQTDPFEDAIERFSVKGIYINLRLRDVFLLRALQEAVDAEAPIGSNLSRMGQRILVEYSSPNVAKQLHAGHIRSTIVGHVLSNIHAACAATVFRVNHLNDLGGFGFLIEGMSRWNDTALAGLPDNLKIVRLYEIRRMLERLGETSANWAGASTEERQLVTRLFGPTDDFSSFQGHVRDYVAKSNAAFERLEAGDQAAVAAWQFIVRESLADFQHFYDALGIHIDFTIGESFYLSAGQALVGAALRSGKAIRYEQANFDADAQALKAAQLDASLTEAEVERTINQLRGYLGAVVVELPNHRKLVVQRSDGRSIYATRDLGAVQERVALFKPDEMIYVVGQEQRDHFQDVFAAARKLDLIDEMHPRCQHLYFGFYVESGSRRKLSSRDGAASVTSLLAQSHRYFLEKLKGSIVPETQHDSVARQLTIASLVFNDLEKDVKGAVEVDVADIQRTIEKFEKAGGAYVIYAACRAGSILDRLDHRRASGSVPSLDSEFSDLESAIALRVLRMADTVVASSISNSPSLLVRSLVELATLYGSYYSNFPVLTDDGVYENRVIVTRAIRRAIHDGLRLCNVECPNRI